MNRVIAFLLLTLAVQAGIVAYQHRAATATQSGNALAAAPLIPSDMPVTDILIGDEYDNETVISRRGELWVLPELLGLPANPARVSELLTALRENSHWPVAHTSAARQRFHVAHYLYQRRLQLFTRNGSEHTVFLGTSPGFRKVHARNEERENVFSIPLSVHDVPAVTRSWLDPRLLQIRSPLSINADSYSLDYDGGQWRSGFGGVPDARELEALLMSLRTLQIEGAPDGDVQRELMDAQADLELVVKSLAGEVTLELFTLEDERYILSSEYPLFFKLSRYDFDRLTGIDFGLISGAAEQNPTGTQ